MSTRRVLKWTVPVDDRPHLIGAGSVLHVACQFGADSVQVWTDEIDGDMPRQRFVQVYGTAQPVPLGAVHVGSVVTASGALVWHVFAQGGAA